MSELSPWFRMDKQDERPVNDGHYEVEYWSGITEKREWRGGYWMFRRDDGTKFHVPSAYIKQWRGVTR